MSIKDRLNKVFRKVFDDDSISVTETMTAEDVEAWDSLSHIQLVVATEKEFAIKLTTIEVSGLKNVGDLLKLIEKKAKA